MKFRTRVPLAILTLAVCAGLASPTSAQNVVISGEPLPADEIRDMPTGSGLVLGRTIDADRRQPVAGATVMLALAGGSARPVAVISDSQGRFVFRNLPKGRFTLMAEKTGYLNGRYGKHLPDTGLDVRNDHVPLELDEREHRGDVVIQMWKRAAIGGLVRDERGEPLVGITVRALRVSHAGGRARFGFESSAGGASGLTDDRGMYRLSSLIPGEYVVVVPVVTETAPRSLGRLLSSPGARPPQMLRDSNYSGSDWIGSSGVSTWALDLADPLSGLAAPVRSPSFAGTTPEGRLLVYEMQFHPDASSLDRAVPIRLRSGEERSTIDFALRPVAAVRVSGRAIGPEGPAADLVLNLIRADASLMTSERAVAQAVTDADGSFAFLGITPGDYTVSALVTPRPQAAPLERGTRVVSGGGTTVVMTGRPEPDPLPSEPTWWAMQPIQVNDRDVDGVQLTLRRGARVSGSVERRGATATPLPSYYRSVYIERADGTQSPNLNLLLGRIDGEGRFASFGQPPGRYFIRVPFAGGEGYFAGAMLGDRDLSRTPIELSDRDVEDVVLVFRDQPGGELSGVVRRDGGAIEYRSAVVVFPTDRESWGAVGRNPRDFRTAGVLGGGRYVVSDLPPGDYFVAALPESRGDWADRTTLEQLAATAVRVALADQERKTLDLTLPRAPGSATVEGENDAHGHGPWAGVEVDEAQAPVRDTRPAPPVGTGVVSGVVVTGERREPVRRARVVLTGAALLGTRVVLSDDEGRFAFAGVPAGRFTLSVEKAAYLTATFGARQPGRPGTPITLADGQHVENVVVSIARGGVTTGTVRDDRGQPLGGAAVQIMHYRFMNGARRLVPYNVAAFFNLSTDDRGIYRFYGIEPGEYAVAASQRTAGMSAHPTTEADVRYAEGVLRSGGTARAAGPPAPNMAAAAATASRPVVHVPFFYPGTPDPSQARLVKVAEGQEVSGIDFVVEAAPAATVRGVVAPAGHPAVEIRLVNARSSGNPGPMLDVGLVLPTRPGPDGAFQFTGVAPGVYTIVATTAVRGGRGDGPGLAPERMWAMASVTVTGSDIDGLVLTLQPAMTVSGSIAFDSTMRPAPALDGVRLSLAPILTGTEVSVGPSQVTVEADGRFVANGLMPGRYAPRALLPSGTQGWIVRSAMLGGRDVMDTGFDVRPGESVEALTVTFTDRPAEISGTLQDPTGRPAPDYFIILFPTDVSMWRAGARRIQQVRPDTTGRFVIRNLVAGGYHLAALTDVLPGEWNDPSFLAQLAASAITIQLAEGEQKTQDIQIRR